MSSNEQNTETDPDSDPILEWEDEAEAIIKDVKQHVKDIQISTKLESSKTNIFLNVTTLEDRKFCARISTEGFQIVGNSYDSIVESIEKTSMAYDTPYALLNDVSAQYVQSFGNGLASALEKLAEKN